MKTNLLIQQVELPDFGLEAPYSEDIWNVCEWDLYKNASERVQNAWLVRTNLMDNKLDFTLCHNPRIREEVKYFSYYLLNVKKVTLGTLAEYADRYKLLFNYIGVKNYSSVLDIDTSDFENYLASTHKPIIMNGSMLSGEKIVPSQKRNRIISFLDFIKNIISDFIESQKPLFERDSWYGKELAPAEHDSVNLFFGEILQPDMKQATKDYIKIRVANYTTKDTYRILFSIKIFCHWLYKYDNTISSFKDVTRDILENYFIYLRVESGFSQSKINRNILHISGFFEFGLINSDGRFPDKVLFLSNDHCFKTKRKANFYTDEEVAAIFSLIQYLPPVYGKILLVLHHTGMRISEVLRLSLDALKEIDGKHYLSVYMYKTKRPNNIPIDDYVYKIISSQIAITKQKFPNAQYVFVNSKGDYFSNVVFSTRIKKEIIKHNVLGRDGKLLRFGTHRFRATKATKLINMGQDPKAVASTLGHANLASLSYYSVATEQSLQSHMQEYLKRASILINSIGKVDPIPLEEHDTAHPLCNGTCCKPLSLGMCDKINACLTCSLFKPSMEHLATYKLQLSEVQSSLAVAEVNGYERMIEQCQTEIFALENIIMKLEEKL